MGHRLALFLGCLLLMLALASGAKTAMAGAPVAPEITAAEANAAWLKTMPDYEMRLYERVTTIKNRQVQLQREVVIGFLVMAAVLGYLILTVIRLRQSVLEGRGAEVRVQERPARSGAPGLPLIDRLEVAQLRWTASGLARRQRRIERMLEALEGPLVAQRGELDGLLAAFRVEIMGLRKAQEEFKETTASGP